MLSKKKREQIVKRLRGPNDFVKITMQSRDPIVCVDPKQVYSISMVVYQDGFNYNIGDTLMLQLPSYGGNEIKCTIVSIKEVEDAKG